MCTYLFEPRSNNYYNEENVDGVESHWQWSDILWLPVIIVILIFIGIAPFIFMVCYFFYQIYLAIKTKIKSTKPLHLFLVSMGILLTLLIFLVFYNRQPSTPTTANPPIPTSSTTSLFEATPTATTHSVNILVDDFSPQPYQGETVYFYNRLEGDRGAINDSIMDWGSGQVTTTISAGNSWGGVWMSLNHPIREGLSINFSAILPEQILPAYQSQITDLTVLIARGTPDRTIKLELKDGNELRWRNETTLDGGGQSLTFDLPALGNINQFVWVLDHASPGDYVVIDRVSFTATTSITDTATAAFVWSYGMLLNNWNPATGLVRDKAKDASGEYDAIQSTGCLAAATAIAAQLGVLERTDATQIVEKIGNTLLLDLPRFHGLWPHWVKTSLAGEISILENTEWSSVDTAIAAIGLLAAQSSLGLETSGTEQFLKAIDWQDLVMPGGISHGYTYAGDQIPYAWDVFGGESWLVELAYAGVTGQVAHLAYPTPPTANGSGFIDELAWLFVPPPSGQDYWGTDWTSYRLAAAEYQVSYYLTQYPTTCFAQIGLFGLSAGEVPDPSKVPQDSIYQAFGVGGHFAASANNGSAWQGAPIVAPHYSAMIASLRPQEAVKMWDWLIQYGHFSPLNNVESLMFPVNSSCDSDAVVWNQLKGSWNLSLQTLGWGRYLATRDERVPILWQATIANPLLQKGYHLLSPNGQSPIPTSTSEPWQYERECEYPDEGNVGQMIWRSNASDSKVHGQFGTTTDSPWPAKSGEVIYDNISTPRIEQLYMKLRYSKYSSSSVPISIYIDNEPAPRAAFYPIDQESWDQFVWTEPILLGKIGSGIHSIKFSTYGQQYGVADLDKFVLTAGPSPDKLITLNTPQPSEPPVTIKWDNTLISCAGKPLYMWSSPGTYLYKQTTDNKGYDYLTVEQKSRKEGPIDGQCLGIPWLNFGDMLPEPPTSGMSMVGYNLCNFGGPIPPGSVSINVVGVEEKTTRWGTFQAVRVDTAQEYQIFTSNLSYPQGLVKTSEWYVCGLGVIRSTISHTGTYQGRHFQSHSGLELLSFAPIPITESPVR